MNLKDVNRQWDQIRGGLGLVRPWLEVCRLHWTLAVAADPLVGALLTGAGFRDIPVILLLMIGTALVHAGAVALNDWHDLKSDRIERPDRPLPAGRVGKWYCLVLAILLLLFGWGLVSAPGLEFGQAGLVMVCIVLIYEFLLKGAPISAVGPGLARAVAMLLGMLVVEAGTSNVTWSTRTFFMGLLAVWSLSSMLLAYRCPDHARRGFAVAAGAVIAAVTVATAAARAFFPYAATHPAAAAWIGLLLVMAGYPVARAIAKPTGVNMQSAAAWTMIATIALQAAMVAFVRGVPTSLAVAVMFLPVVYARKWLMQHDDAVQQHATSSDSHEPLSTLAVGDEVPEP